MSESKEKKFLLTTGQYTNFITFPTEFIAICILAWGAIDIIEGITHSFDGIEGNAGNNYAWGFLKAYAGGVIMISGWHAWNANVGPFSENGKKIGRRTDQYWDN